MTLATPKVWLELLAQYIPPAIASSQIPRSNSSSDAVEGSTCRHSSVVATRSGIAFSYQSAICFSLSWTLGPAMKLKSSLSGMVTA